jgi:hypothetical protein
MSRPRLRWRHATIEGLREAVLPRGTAPGGQCRYNGTRNTTLYTSTEPQCFLLGLCGGYMWRIERQAIFSSDRMLHKDYDRNRSVEKLLWSWVSMGLTPRRTDWRQNARRKVTRTLTFKRVSPSLSRESWESLQSDRTIRGWAPIVVSPCVATPSCETGDSQRGLEAVEHRS